MTTIHVLPSFEELKSDRLIPVRSIKIETAEESSKDRIFVAVEASLPRGLGIVSGRIILSNSEGGGVEAIAYEIDGNLHTLQDRAHWRRYLESMGFRIWGRPSISGESSYWFPDVFDLWGLGLAGKFNGEVFGGLEECRFLEFIRKEYAEVFDPTNANAWAFLSYLESKKG